MRSDLTIFFLLSAALPAVFAHTLFTTLFINDVNQGDAVSVRMPMTPGNATAPAAIDLQDVAMACGAGPNNYAALASSVPSGSKLSFLFRVMPDGSSQESLDISHKGPMSVYLKNVASPFETGQGDGWFKIWDAGYDSATSSWASESLMQNNHMLSVDIPDNLAGGYYLVRPEILALHDADKTPPNPQFYIGCAQIFLGAANSGSGVLPETTVEIPGYVTIENPSVLFNIYDPAWPYHMPGPPPYTLGDPTTSTTQILSHKIGVLPKDVLVRNANWWAMPFESYTSNAGCWNASSSCFSQLTTCYASAPPTGSQGCRRLEHYCGTIQQSCNQNSASGPPAMAPDTTPAVSYSIPAVASQPQGQTYAAQYQAANFGYLVDGAGKGRLESRALRKL